MSLKAKAVQLLWRVWAYCETHDWISWCTHVGIGLLLSPLIGTWPVWWGYAFREAGQVIDMQRAGTPQPWTDHAMDVIAPGIALTLAHAWFGW